MYVTQSGPVGTVEQCSHGNTSSQVADADEARAEAISPEEEDLANDLGAEEETRQNAYASAAAGWLSDEAAAHVA